MNEGKNPLLIGVVVLGAAATAVGVYLNLHKAAAPAPEAPPIAAPAPASPLLPALGQSDDYVRGRAAALSPLLGDWLKAEGLIRRAAAALDLIANGKSPRESLDFLAPRGRFAAVKKDGKLFLDKKSYARYDSFAKVVDSIDAAGAAKLFLELKPLLQDACLELGYRRCEMQDTAARAVKELLGAPLVDAEIQLHPKITTYAMADPALEGLSAAQKQLLRMGPRNAGKIQAKLRDFARGLGVPDAELPQTKAYTASSN